MHKKTRETLIAKGFRTSLIDKIAKNRHTVANLDTFSKTQLSEFYTKAEVKIIVEKVKRKPILSATVKEILRLSNEVCCYCKDGNSGRPYQIHHIEEHAISQDDSLENLMLICPTHHMAVPQKKYTIEEQKEVRKSWYVIAEIERNYRERGIPFPYDSFEALTTESKPNLTELISLQKVSPSTARDAYENILSKSAQATLSRENFLMITGRSGSGKSTFAAAIAVSFPDTRVFRYITPTNLDNRQIQNEIITFISNVTKPSILILDDINLWATKDDIQKISNSVNFLLRIIATATNLGTSSEEPEIDSFFISNRIFIDWNITKPYIIEYLKDNEPDVVTVLNHFRDHRVSIGNSGDSLDYLIRSYKEKVKSVWQFIFLLREGWKAVENELNQLISMDRADIAVAYIAIEQLADSERPVSKEEINKIITEVSTRESLPSDLEWTEKILERLVKRRVLNKVRNHYITIHRQWARAFVCEALKNTQSSPVVTKLLERDFDLNTSQPKRLALLLSWFDRGNSHCRDFAHNWIKNQSPNDWFKLLGRALEQGLETASIVASELSRLSLLKGWKDTLRKAAEPHENIIKNHVKNATAEDWENLENLLHILSDDLCRRVIKEWDPQLAAEVLNNTNPDYYYSIYWLLGGNICKHSQDWCRDVGKNIDLDLIIENLSKVRKGDVKTIETCIDILSRLEVPVMRSMVSRFADIISDTLKGTPFVNISFGEGIKILFEIFPVEINKIISALDAKKIAEEISTIPPHKWEDLMSIFWVANRAGSTFSKEFFENLDENKLILTIEKYAQVHPRTFLVLLYLLKYASSERRNKILEKLYDSAVIACKHQQDGKCVLEAFLKIDKTITEKIAKEIEIDFDSIETESEDEEGILDKPLLDTAEGGAEAKELIRDREASGEDYDVGIVIWGSGKKI